MEGLAPSPVTLASARNGSKTAGMRCFVSTFTLESSCLGARGQQYDPVVTIRMQMRYLCAWCQGRRCRRRTDVGDFRRKSVTTSRDGRDRIGFQNLAQRRDMHLQGVLFDNHFGPNALEQFVLSDQMPAAFNQRDQQIEGTRADAHWRAGCQQTSFVGLELESSKPITDRCVRSSHRGQPIASRL